MRAAKKSKAKPQPTAAATRVVKRKPSCRLFKTLAIKVATAVRVKYQPLSSVAHEATKKTVQLKLTQFFEMQSASPTSSASASVSQ
eukprot:8314278-Pyramimonas_sp.AAC.1